MPVLKTDGGDHTPEKWAMATAQMLAPVDLNAPGARQVMNLQGQLADLLVPHHKKVQDGERASLAASGDAHLANPLTPKDFVDAAYAEVVAAFNASPYAAKTQDPDWQVEVKSLLAAHFATSQFTARSWHADRPGASPEAIAWKKSFHAGAPQEPEPAPDAPDPDPEPEQAAA